MRTVAAALACVVHLPGVALAQTPDQNGKAVLPGAAEEGARDLKALAPSLAAFVRAQPYGKHWRQIADVGPKPKDGAGTAKAETHPSLQYDEIEMQQQAQFLADGGVEVRYGLVSIRGVRVFRYGRLVGAQLVLERIGRDRAADARFRGDLRALRAAWKNPLTSLGLSRFAVVTRDGLALDADPKADITQPIRIELEPSIDRRSKK